MDFSKTDFLFELYKRSEIIIVSKLKKTYTTISVAITIMLTWNSQRADSNAIDEHIRHPPPFAKERPIAAANAAQVSSVRNMSCDWKLLFSELNCAIVLTIKQLKWLWDYWAFCALEFWWLRRTTSKETTTMKVTLELHIEPIYFIYFVVSK